MSGSRSRIAGLLALALGACGGEEAPTAPAPEAPRAAEPARGSSEPTPTLPSAPEAPPGPSDAPPSPVLTAYLETLVRAANAVHPQPTEPPICTARHAGPPLGTTRAGRMIDGSRLLAIGMASATGTRIPPPRPRSVDRSSFLRDEELDRLTAAIDTRHGDAPGRSADAELARRLATDAPWLTVVELRTFTPPDAGAARAGLLDGNLFFVQRVEGRVLCVSPIRVEQPASAVAPGSDPTVALELFQRQVLTEILARVPAELASAP